MKTLNLNHGHESLEHRALKAEVIRFLHRWGYGTILAEHQNCDLVAVRPSGAKILSVEIERSSRTQPWNSVRDFNAGCDSVLITCPNFKVLGEVARKLARSLPLELWDRTGLVTISALRLIQPFSPIQESHNTTSKGNS